MTANRNSEAAARGMPAAAKLLIGAILVAAVAAGGYFLHQQRAQAASTNTPSAAPAAQAKRVPVVVTPAAVRDFERALVVQGNVQAKDCLRNRVAGSTGQRCW